MTVYGTNSTDKDQVYSYADCALTHRKPHYLCEVEDQLAEAERDYMNFCDLIENGQMDDALYIGFYEALDRFNSLERRRQRLHDYWLRTHDDELPIPFDSRSDLEWSLLQAY